MLYRAPLFNHSFKSCMDKQYDFFSYSLLIHIHIQISCFPNLLHPLKTDEQLQLFHNRTVRTSAHCTFYCLPSLSWTSDVKLMIKAMRSQSLRYAWKWKCYIQQFMVIGNIFDVKILQAYVIPHSCI